MRVDTKAQEIIGRTAITLQGLSFGHLKLRCVCDGAESGCDLLESLAKLPAAAVTCEKVGQTMLRTAALTCTVKCIPCEARTPLEARCLKQPPFVEATHSEVTAAAVVVA